MNRRKSLLLASLALVTLGALAGCPTELKTGPGDSCPSPGATTTILTATGHHTLTCKPGTGVDRGHNTWQ